jgi:hypothetical protein
MRQALKRGEIHIKFLSKNLYGIDHAEDLRVDERIILK